MYLYPLFSGSSGNCSVIRHGKSTILLDAGLTGAAITKALVSCRISPDNIDAILVTHEHSDHIKGVGVLSRKYGIPVYANAKTWEVMTPLIGNISGRHIRIFDTGHDFFIGDINIRPFSIPHDCIEPVAYSFHAGGRKLSVATDIGHITPSVESELKNSDLVLIESNHDIDMLRNGSYPAHLKKRILGSNGHLSNESCGDLLTELSKHGLKRAILGHLSNENNTEFLASSTVRNVLNRHGISSKEFSLCVAHRDRILGIFEV